MSRSHLVVAFLCFLLGATPLCSADATDSLISQLIADKDFASAEKLLRQALQQQPTNQTHRFQLARVLAWQEKFENALLEYNTLLGQNPENSDYLLGKAQVLSWAGRPHDAVRLLASARSLTPDYIDVWQLEIKSLRQINSAASNEQADVLLTEARKRFPEENWANRLIQVKEKKQIYTEVSIGLSQDDLNSNFVNWSGQYLEAEHQFSSGQKIYGVVNLTDRFDLKDEEILAGIYQPINTAWGAVVEAGLSPSHKVRPKWFLSGQLQHELSYGWNTHLGLQYTEYSETDTKRVNANIERYWEDYRMGYAIYATTVSGEAIKSETHYTHALSLDYYYETRSSIGIVLTTGDELEYNGTATPPISSINGLIIKGRHWFTPQWAINYDLNYHEQGDIYSRHGFRVGVRYRY